MLQVKDLEETEDSEDIDVNSDEEGDEAVDDDNDSDDDDDEGQTRLEDEGDLSENEDDNTLVETGKKLFKSINIFQKWRHVDVFKIKWIHKSTSLSELKKKYFRIITLILLQHFVSKKW